MRSIVLGLRRFACLRPPRTRDVRFDESAVHRSFVDLLRGADQADTVARGGGLGAKAMVPGSRGHFGGPNPGWRSMAFNFGNRDR